MKGPSLTPAPRSESTATGRLRAGALALLSCAWAFSSAAAAADLGKSARGAPAGVVSDLRAAVKLAGDAATRARIQSIREQLIEADSLQRGRFEATARRIQARKLPARIEQRLRDTLAAYDRGFTATLDDIDAAASATSEAQAKAKLTTALSRLSLPSQVRSKPRLMGKPVEKTLRKPRLKKKDLRLSFAEDAVMLADAGMTGLVMAASTVGVPTAEHLAQTEDAQITPAIRDLASQLHNNPVEIYHWVRNNIDYLPTFGSIQGSELTYLNRHGNAYDTASLLIALLRAAGVPARYVYGTAEIPVAEVLNWIGGVETTEAALDLFAQVGIPAATVVEGGKVARVQLEHVWVEAWVDFEPSRGVRNLEGDSWVPMDASFKQYVYTQGLDLARDLRFDGETFIQTLSNAATRDDTLGSATGIDPAAIQTQIEAYRRQVNRFIAAAHPNATVAQVLGGRTLVQQNLSGLSPVLPYKVVVSADATTALPDSLRWKLKLELFASNADRGAARVSAGLTRSLPALGNKALSVGFVPETSDDEEALASYLPQPHADGSPIQPEEFPDEIPGYLIHVRPQVLLGGEPLSIGTATALGTALPFVSAVFNPSQQAWEVLADETIEAGEHHGIAVDGAGLTAGPLTASADSLAVLRQRLAARNLSNLEREDITGATLRYTALNYLGLIDANDRLFQSIGGIVGVRLPSIGRAFTDLEAELAFGVPTAVRYPGASLRVDRLVSAITPAAQGAATSGYLPYRRASLERASAYSHGVLENIFGTPAANIGASAIRVLAQSAVSGVPVFLLRAANLDTALEAIELPAHEEGLLRDGIAANLQGLAPKNAVVVGQRDESAYVITDPQIGAGDYRLSGGDSGHLHGRNLLWLALGSPDQSAAGAVPIIDAIQDQQGATEFLLSDMDGTRWTDFPGQDEVTDSLLLSFVNVGAGEGAAPWVVVATTAESTSGAITSDGSVNKAPRFTTSPLTDAIEGEAYRYSASAADPEGDRLTYSVASGPSGVKISSSGLVSWDQPVKGSWTIVLRVDDGKAYTEQAYGLVVAKGPEPLDAELKLGPTLVQPSGQPVAIQFETFGGKGTVTRQLSINGQNVAIPANAANPYAFYHPAPGAPGNYVVVARASDEERTVERMRTFSVAGHSDTQAPVVSISSPVNDQEVRGPIKVVGTISDANLSHYVLMYRPSGSSDNDWIEIARGTDPVAEAALGTFNSTKLDNGIYDIGLFVFDTNGRTSGVQVPVEIVGDLKTGQFSLSFVDLELETKGIPIRITRTYDTRKKERPLDFGYGWTAAYQDFSLRQNMKIGLGWAVTNVAFQICARVVGQRKVSITLPDGSVDRFRVNSADQCATGTTPVPDVHFDPLPGTTSTLEIANVPSLEFRGGNIVERVEFEVWNPQDFKLTREDGLIYHLKNGVGITKVEDVDGNVLTYGPNGIQHSSGIGISFVRDSEGRITSITDLAGKQLKYEYDANGDLVTFTNRAGEVTRISYNREHGLVEYTDARGIVVARQIYDEEGRLVATIDADGKRTEMDHDVEASTERVTNKRGFTTIYKYDENGNVEEVIDALGHKTAYVHDAMGNELKVTDPLGHVTERAFDPQHGKVLWEKDPLGNTTHYTYQVATRTDKSQKLAIVKDARGNETLYGPYSGAKPNKITEPLGKNTLLWGQGSVYMIWVTTGRDIDGTFHKWSDTGTFVDNPMAGDTYVTDGLGHRTDRKYDSNGKLVGTSTTRTLLDGTKRTVKTSQKVDSEGRVIEQIDPAGYKTTTTYTKAGKPRTVTDALGRTTTYDYDRQDRLTTTTYADGTSESVSYDENGNEIARTDRGGRTTRFEYDALDRLTKTIHPDGTSNSQEYDAAGRVTKAIDAKGNPTLSTYDAAGRLTSVRNALGHTTKFEYDENGNRSKVTDAKNQSTVFTYDALNRLTKTTHPDGTFSTIAYRPDGLKESQTDETGRQTRYDYDFKGQLTSVTQVITPPGDPNPVEAVTRYEYDELGNKTKQIDAEGRVTKWEYDDLNRVAKRILPLGQTESFEYDGAGNLKAHKDFNGNTIRHAVDSNDRETLKSYPDNKTVRTTYTRSGPVDAQVDYRGTIDHDYDARDRLTRVSSPEGVIRYQYDDSGNRTLIATNNQTQRFRYDDLNRLIGLTGPDGKDTTYEYDENGNKTRISYPNGTTATYTYDSRNRVTDIHHRRTADNHLYLHLHYTFAANSQRTRTDEADHVGLIATHAYDYDGLGRLTKHSYEDHRNASRSKTTAWTYDKVGNRLTQLLIQGATARSTAARHDANDRLVGETKSVNDVISATVEYAYDERGNAVRKRLSPSGSPTVLKEFVWDYEGRLRSLAVNGRAIASYQYDPVGNRTRKAAASAITSFLTDRNRNYAEVLEEDQTSTKTLFVHGDGLEVLQRHGPAQADYYHLDAMSSTRMLTGSDGLPTKTVSYDAFGETVTEDDHRYLFAGEANDEDLDLVYLRARYLDPTTGEFVSGDPFQGLIDRPNTLHRYAYAANDPINRIDPTGETFTALSISNVTTTFMQGVRIQGAKTARDRILFGNPPKDYGFIGEVVLLLMIEAIDQVLGVEFDRKQNFGTAAHQNLKGLLGPTCPQYFVPGYCVEAEPFFFGGGGKAGRNEAGTLGIDVGIYRISPRKLMIGMELKTGRGMSQTGFAERVRRSKAGLVQVQFYLKERR